MAGIDMELENLKLYLENQIISEENKKLRNKVNHLRQENLVLMSELEKKFPRLAPYSAALYVLHKYWLHPLKIFPLPSLFKAKLSS